MSQNKSPHVLGTENVGKLLISYSIPAIIAMVASSLYNITDSIFIGHGVGALAISGLALCFPLMNLSAAFGSLVGAGGATLVSIKLGQKDRRGAIDVLGNVVTLNVILGVLFALICLLFLDPVLLFFGASEATLPYAHDYMKVVLYGNVFTHLYMGLNSVMRAAGNPQKAMIATLMTVLINAVLDALFIFGLGWGIKGSAWATIIAQTIVLVWIMCHFTTPDSYVRFKKGSLRLKQRIISGILSIGVSPFLMNACACLVVILINKGMYRYGGDMAIGAYGIVNRIVFCLVMIVMGFNQGMQPIAGYNFGAKLYERVTQVTSYTLCCGIGVTAIGFLLGEFCPTLLAKMFTTDAELIAASAMGMRLVTIVFPVAGFQMVVCNFFQSIGMAKKAVMISLLRQMVCLVPLLLILPPWLGVIGVWISMPISDLISAAISACIFFSFKKKIKKMKAGETVSSQLA